MESIELGIITSPDYFGDGPTSFVVKLDDADRFRSRLRKLNEICVENSLAEARDFHNGYWLDSSGEPCVVEYSTLVVTDNCFWFECLLKFTDIRVETHALDLPRYLKKA